MNEKLNDAPSLQIANSKRESGVNERKTMGKYVMRGMLFSKTKKQLGIAALVAATASASWYFFYMKPKYERYNHYFK